MRWMLIIFALCGSAWASPGWNAAAPNAVAGGGGTSVTSGSLILGQNHILIIRTSYQTSAGAATVTDTAFSLTYNVWRHDTFNSGNSTVDVGCMFTGTNTGADSFKISFGGSTTFFDIYAVEDVGETYASCAAALDGTTGTATNVATGSSSGTHSVTQTSVTNADTIYESCDAGNTVLSGAGFINPANSTNSGFNSIWGFEIAGAAGAQTASCSTAASTVWLVQIVLLKPGTANTGIFIRDFTGNQSMSSGTGGPINLPNYQVSGDYVLCAASPETRPAYATQGFSALSGWTTLLANGGVGIWGQIWTSGTATPTVVAQQNNGFYEGMCAEYANVNSSTPVDMVNDFWIDQSGGQDAPNAPSPAVFPSWTTDMLVSFNAQTSNAGDQPIGPSTLNPRYIVSGLGPFIAAGDVNLTNANATVPTNYLWTKAGGAGATTGRHTASVLLMPASGGTSATRQTQPTVEAANRFVGAGTASTANLYPVVGDVIVAEFFGTGGTCTSIPAGYTAVYNTNDMLFATHAWTISDTTGSLGGFGCPGGQSNTYVIHNAVNPATSPQVFSSNTATHAATTSDGSPSIATISNSLLLLQYSAGNSGSPINGAWTPPVVTGLFQDSAWTASSQTTTLSMWQQAPANPTGVITATNTVSGTQNSGAVDFCIVCSANHRRAWVIGQ